MDKSQSINCQGVDDRSWDLDEDDDDGDNNEKLQGPVENLSSNSWDSSSAKENHREGKSGNGKRNCHHQETEVDRQRENGEEKIFKRVSPCSSWKSCNLNRTIKAADKQVFAVSDSSSSDSLNSLDDMGISLPFGNDAVKFKENSPARDGDQSVVRRKSRKPETQRSCSSEDIIISWGDDIQTHAVESEEVSDKDHVRRIKEENPVSYLFEEYQHGMNRNNEKIEEHCLVIEDLEESEEPGMWMCKNQENMTLKMNNCNKNAYTDDAPKILASEGIHSNDDNVSIYNLIWKSENRGFTMGKSKSIPNFLNLAASKKTAKKSRSLEKVSVQNFCPSDILIQHEGCRIRKGRESKLKNFLANVKDMGDASVRYQKIECRTLHTVIDNTKAKPSKESKNSEDVLQRSAEKCYRSGSPTHESTSSKLSEEAVSLPNAAEKEKNGEKSNLDFRPVTSSTGNTNLMSGNQSITPGKPPTQSWLLLDEMGQSQPVTLVEVNFLLNGKSADTVLQENKEHFIPRSTILRNANSDFHVDRWNPIIEESLQHFLHEDDVCGEHSVSKSIGLERKFGNMLLYIQSGVNLTSSVRFIPVDTEMIQMWKQAKDSVSPISSEDDARAAIYENITEDVSEMETLETSDDIQRNFQDLQKVSPAVRKKRCKQNKTDDHEKRLMGNRRIIESLMDDVTQLRMRLETERNRNSELEQEICLLRNKQKSGATSHMGKTRIAEECRNVDHALDVTSSSLLSIEELKKGSVAAANINENRARSTSGNAEEIGSLRDNQRNFKQALDKNISEIGSILKCKPRNQERNGAENEESLNGERLMPENWRMSSMFSISSYAAEETSSRNLSQMSNSVDSWFTSRKPDAGKDIIKTINELERENEKLVSENLDLKRKLNEISIELDDYVSGNSMSSPVEEARQAESLRNQVCSLKLELENLKNIPKKKEQARKVKEDILREELSEKTVLLETWQASITNMFLEMGECREKLKEIGISTVSKINGEKIGSNPNDILLLVRSLIAELSNKIFDYKSENSILKSSLQENILSGAKSSSFGKNCEYLEDAPKFIFGNISEISETSAGEYCKVLAEKVTLEEETRNLRKENDILLEYQIDHNEKLKNATLALLEEKSKVSTMEKAIKIYEMEKGEVSQVLIGQQEEMELLERELEKKKCKLTEFRACYENKRAEVIKLEEKLQEVSEKCKTFDETFCRKDEIINELKNSCSELESKEFLSSGQIQFLTDQLNKLQDEKSSLEEDLLCTKEMAEETKKGMCEYISHLETMVNNAEEKYNETYKSFSTLKKRHDDLEKQNASNLKMFQESRDEAEYYREIAKDLEERNKEVEEIKKKVLDDLNTIVKSEGEKTKNLEKLIGERKTLDREISVLKTRLQNQARMKDRLLKEQKDLKNESAMLKRENAKLAQKYRSMKSECNERTKLLKHINGKMKENFFEYNRRIECLENNVSIIVEKAAAFKNCVIEKRSEVNAVVRELQNQLNEVYMEKKNLENEAAGFCQEIKRLQKEMNERKTRNVVFSTATEHDSFPSNNAKMTPSDISDASYSNSKTTAKVDDVEIRVKQAATDVIGAQEKIKLLESSKQQEKEAYEAIIGDLKSEIARYQIRMKVLRKNLPTCGKSKRDVAFVKRNPEEFNAKISELEQKVKELTDELEKRRRQILEMTEVVESGESEIKKKEEECNLLKEKVSQLKRETRSMTSKFSKLQEFLSTVNKNVEVYQKERDEVSEKLAETLKLIVEEKASRQNGQLIFAEKEKFFKEQIKIRLTEKKKNYEVLLNSLDEKKKIISKLQDDVKKWKGEVSALKDQVRNLKEQNYIRNEAYVNAEGGDANAENGKRSSKVESELREIRETNLELRKREGNLQARIVLLEDSLRSARLLIKEVEGDLFAERKSKSLLKDMIATAGEEIERFKRSGQIAAATADKIQRHFHSPQVESRQMFSDYRTGDEQRKPSAL